MNEPIKRKSGTLLDDVLRAIGCRKRSANWSTYFPELWSYWNDGSRDVWYQVNLKTLQVTRPVGVVINPPQFGGKAKTWEPLPNTILINCGTFCGKPSTPHIYATDELIYNIKE